MLAVAVVVVEAHHKRLAAQVAAELEQQMAQLERLAQLT
jgi:hypothetical protein